MRFVDKFLAVLPYLRGLLLCLQASIATFDLWGFVLFAGVACDKPLRPVLLAYGIAWLILFIGQVAIWIWPPPTDQTKPPPAILAMGLAGLTLIVVTIVGHVYIAGSATCAKTSSAKGAAKFGPGVEWMMGSSMFAVTLQNCIILDFLLVCGIIFKIIWPKEDSTKEPSGAFGSGSSSV
jgi:hypothetical protein